MSAELGPRWLESHQTPVVMVTMINTRFEETVLYLPVAISIDVIIVLAFWIIEKIAA